MAVRDYVWLPWGDEEPLRQWIANEGPAAIALYASGFQLYQSGVYECDNNTAPINHGVNIVGYGTTDDGIDYWIMRNRYGTPTDE